MLRVSPTKLSDLVQSAHPAQALVGLTLTLLTCYRTSSNNEVLQSHVDMGAELSEGLVHLAEKILPTWAFGMTFQHGLAQAYV